MVKKESALGHNLLIIGASVLVAILLERGGAFDFIIHGSMEFRLLGALVAGFFFTSFVTTVPAILALGHIGAQGDALLPIVIAGGLGALIGDLILLYIVKGAVTPQLHHILSHVNNRRIKKILESRIFTFISPVIGALIIASPLPDELGLSLLGISRVPLALFIPLSFTMNCIGIALIALAARAF